MKTVGPPSSHLKLRNSAIALITLVLLGLTAGLVFHFKNSPTSTSSTVPLGTAPSPSSTTTGSGATPASTTAPQTNFVLPIADFYIRITKKTFGLYITPKTSPVQPERFSGYHTGDDVEYTDTTSDVPVYAIASGEVVLSRTASGYGGVLALRFSVDGKNRVAIYGHLRPTSLTATGTKVTKGQQLAVLGTGYSSETDGERRHLHFAIRSDSSINILGYVQNQADLTGWVDPVTFFKGLGL